MKNNKTYDDPKNKQEELANMQNSPQVSGANINQEHNIKKQAMGPNTKR